VTPLLQSSMFVHPQFAWVAACVAGLPVLIHLINRRRCRREPWAAMRFLLAASRRSARRMRIEQWLVLLVRIAIVSLLALAVARPFFPSLPLASLGTRRVHHILLIDNSFSMSAPASSSVDARSGRVPTRFERAVAACRELLAAIPDGDAISLVTMADPARQIISHAAYDRRGIREQLGRLRVSQRATDTHGALAAALSILEQSRFPPANRVVHLIGDFPASQWFDAGEGSTATVGLARQVADRAGLVFVHVGEGDSADHVVPNLAVTDVRSTSAVAGAELPLRLHVEVANYSSQVARGVSMQVIVDGSIVRRAPLQPIGAFATRTMSLSFAMGQPGQHVLNVAIESARRDALPPDNARFHALDILESQPVLLVDGRPDATSLGGACGYLAAALAPQTESSLPNMFSPRVIVDRDLSFEPLGDYGVVALCNVPRLDPAEWQRLESFVAGGGGLLVFFGERTDVANYNENGFRGGQGVLPCRLGAAVQAPASAATAERFLPGEFKHPALVDFSENPDSGLFLARIRRYVTVADEASDARVPLRYTSGQPALLTKRLGDGRCALFTTSSDMSWSNLPAKGDFVPLMVNWVSYLSPTRSARRVLRVGDSIVEPLAPHEASFALRVRTPGGDTHDARVEAVGDKLFMRFGPLEQAGVYDVSVGRRRVSYVANIDASESDLRTADVDRLRTALQCAFTHVESGDWVRAVAARASSNEVGGMILLLVLALVIFESWLTGTVGAYR